MAHPFLLLVSSPCLSATPGSFSYRPISKKYLQTEKHWDAHDPKNAVQRCTLFQPFRIPARDPCEEVGVLIIIVSNTKDWTRHHQAWDGGIFTAVAKEALTRTQTAPTASPCFTLQRRRVEVHYWEHVYMYMYVCTGWTSPAMISDTQSAP